MNSHTSIKRILFLAANPKDTPPLRLDEEMREVHEGLRRASRHHRFILEQRWAVRPRDMRQAMLEVEPQIVHFSGHGAPSGGVILENIIGEAHVVEPEALADLFRLFTGAVECVLLNACYSEAQAEAINQHIDYVIGMSTDIGDKAAIEFSIGFYDALGAGKPVDLAFQFGCNAIQMEGFPEHLTPVLKTRYPSDKLPLEPERRKQWILVLSATINEVDRAKAEAIVEHLRELSKDTSMTLLKVLPGSVLLMIESSQEGFERINLLYKETQLGTILDIVIEGIQETSIGSKQTAIKDADVDNLKEITIEHIPNDDLNLIKSRLWRQIESMEEAELRIVAHSQDSLAYFIASAFRTIALLLGYAVAFPIAWARKVVEVLWHNLKPGWKNNES